jgi:hypothetical protein
MNAHKRLMDVLFSDKERAHVDLKFFRGTGLDVSPDDLCDAAVNAIFQVNSGMVERMPEFGDRNMVQIEVEKIVASA